MSQTATITLTKTQTFSHSRKKSRSEKKREKKRLKKSVARPSGHAPLFDEPVTWWNWYKYVNWLNTFFVGSPLVLWAYALSNTVLHRHTLYLSAIMYFCGGISITAGYHRYFSHNSYRAHWSLRLFYALFGASAVQGSIRWWVRGHRAHHRYLDTDKDPHNAHRGLFWSHIGWLIMRRPRSKIGYADVSDLDSDPIVRWQHNNYSLIAIFMSFILPTAIAGFGWGDWRGGYFYAGAARLACVHQATFCINSLAHYLGDATYDDRHSPRDHFLTAFLTMGEGYHNFHHAFPIDYRAAVGFWQWDPTKWWIYVCSWIGLTSDLKRFPENEVVKGRLNMKQKKLDRQKSKVDWGVPIRDLPVISFEEFQRLCKQEKRSLILIEGVVHDVSEFIDEHPGGRQIMQYGIGKDMTAAFNGGVYNHLNAARNLMAKMRVAVVEGGMEVETLKTKGK
ncbi:uncharacterized protein VTP21DRAFT_10517 [Calcarisporiella thermophila]|uniref:uncharacterized protein n=1 Tax=Calcarisporiella thermophila TaxID=911321 RepID=UPI0037426EA5